MPKICITGATGFVGAHLVRHFAHRGYEVIAVGRQQSPPPKLLQLARWVRADITRPLPRIECDWCIHAAALAADRGTPEAFTATNVRGTEHVFRAVTAPHFIQISSASAYNFSTQPQRETDAYLNPKLSLYGRSKLEAEQWLAQHASQKASVTVLRPRAIYGTHDRVLLPRILGLVKWGRIILPGTAEVALSMTHISNLIVAIEAVIPAEQKGFYTYNVADEQTYQLREVITQLNAGVHQKNIPYLALPLHFTQRVVTFLQKVQIPVQLTTSAIDYVSQPLTLDLTRIQTELGYRAATDFYRELPQLLAWIRRVGLEKVRRGEH